jgi:glycosyltransferase involved in cell wall biosynthesis
MMLLSILIATLESRRETFLRLHRKLNDQLRRHALQAEVEILVLEDNGQLSIGSKRNALIEQARGRYVVFIDDDDDISEDYARLITDAIRRQPEIDCIGIKGQITFRGQHPRLLVYSIRYQEFRTENGAYCRPPQHITPIRRDIARRYKFANTSYSEDFDWALQMRRDRALEREYFIDEILYYYFSRRRWAYQWLLDQTESLRHLLGLQLVNRVRLRRWLAAPWAAKGETKHVGE